MSAHQSFLGSMIKVLRGQNHGLHICHINAQSLLPKIDEFRDLFEDSAVDVVCVSETWFSDAFTDDLCRLNGYKVFRSDRIGRIGGGVAIYVRDGLKCRLRDFSCDGCEIEYVFVELVNDESKLLIGTAYRPNRHVNLLPLIDAVDEISLSCPNVILCGDLNSNLLTETHLIEEMSSFNLFPVNTTVPTHFSDQSSSLLDLFLVNHINKVLLYDQLSAPSFSRHDLIYITFEFHIVTSARTLEFRDFKNINYTLLEEHTRSVDWDTIYRLTSPDEKVEFLNTNIANLYNRHVPLRTKTLLPNSAPWFSNQIRALMRQRDLAYNRWKRFRLESHRSCYCTLRNKVVTEIRVAKSLFYSNRLNASMGSRLLWRNLRHIGVGKCRDRRTEGVNPDELNHKFISSQNHGTSTQIPQYLVNLSSSAGDASFCFLAVSSTDLVESLLSVKSNAVGLDEIHPSFLKIILPVVLPHLTHIFNSVVTSGIFPVQWKSAKVVPVPKTPKGDEFRPISILPFLSKVFEKILQKQIGQYLSTHNILSPKQSGFRQKHSCTTTVIGVSDDIRIALDEGKVSFLILLDFSKAFDTVVHSTLYLKLSQIYNFSPCAIKLISSYLTGRVQAVEINHALSGFLPIVSGVPQGSILGPLLFSLYVNELPTRIRHCSIHMYADDVQLVMSCPLGLIEHATSCINEDLEGIAQWSRSNGLFLNPDKSKCIVVSKKPLDLSYFPSITLNSAPVEFVESVKNLGMTFDRNLAWDKHINQAVGKTYGVLRTLWVSHSFTPIKTRTLLAKTLAVPLLTYGCEIFSNCSYASKRKLNVAFNSIVRYVFGLRRFDRVSGYSKYLYGMTFDKFLQFRTLIRFSDIMRTHQPAYLYEKIRFPSSSRSGQIILPRHTCLTSERQFFINSIRLWNSLPHSIRRIDNTVRLKEELQKMFSLNS